MNFCGNSDIDRFRYGHFFSVLIVRAVGACAVIRSNKVSI